MVAALVGQAVLALVVEVLALEEAFLALEGSLAWCHLKQRLGATQAASPSHMLSLVQCHMADLVKTPTQLQLAVLHTVQVCPPNTDQFALLRAS